MYSSPQDLLAQSIHRAKLTIHKYSPQDQLPETRMDYAPPPQPRKEEGAAAAAIKTLQLRVGLLEEENTRLQHQLRSEIKSTFESGVQTPCEWRDKQGIAEVSEVKELQETLRMREVQWSEKYSLLQGQLRQNRRDWDTLRGGKDRQLEKIKQIQLEKEKYIADLREEWSRDIDKLQTQLQREKKSNWAQIRLYQELMDEKQNILNQHNLPVPQNEGKKTIKSGEQTKKELTQMKLKNQQMFLILQRNKVTLAKQFLSCKQSRDNYAHLKMITDQIIVQVKTLPNLSAHIRHLLLNYDRLDHTHVKTLRSQSRSKSRSQSGSQSKQQARNNHSPKSSGSKSGMGVRGLKMEDLASSKKQRSKSRSVQKCCSDTHVVTEAQPSDHQRRQALEKEVTRLKKLHRNLMIRTARTEITPQEKLEIDQVINQYNRQKQALDQLSRPVPTL